MLGRREQVGRPGLPTFDRLGTLCVEGQEVATYLFHVPDDAAQWQRVRDILDAVLRETAQSSTGPIREIAHQMERAFSSAPSATVTEQLITGFDRLIALSLSDRRGREEQGTAE